MDSVAVQGGLSHAERGRFYRERDHFYRDRVYLRELGSLHSLREHSRKTEVICKNGNVQCRVALKGLFLSLR